MGRSRSGKLESGARRPGCRSVSNHGRNIIASTIWCAPAESHRSTSVLLNQVAYHAHHGALLEILDGTTAAFATTSRRAAQAHCRRAAGYMRASSAVRSAMRSKTARRRPCSVHGLHGSPTAAHDVSSPNGGVGHRLLGSPRAHGTRPVVSEPKRRQPCLKSTPSIWPVPNPAVKSNSVGGSSPKKCRSD